MFFRLKPQPHGRSRSSRRSPKGSARSTHCARHLFRGDCGYYARMAVPHALRAIVGKKELWTAIKADSNAGAVATPLSRGSTLSLTRHGRKPKVGRVQAAPPRPGRSLAPQQLAVTHYGDQVRLMTN